VNAIIKSEIISRRKALSLMGLAAAFGLAAAPTVLTVSDAAAQTVGMQRRQERRAGRHERRDERRTGRTERREERRTGTLPRLRRVQLPVQLSNLTGPARSGRYEPVLVPPMCTPEARADAMYLRLTRRLTYVASQPIRWSRSAQACGLNRRCPIRE